MYTEHVSDLKSEVELPSERGRSWSGRLLNFLPKLAVACLILQSTGCMTGPYGAFMDEQMGGYRNHVWARRAYNLRYGNCDRDYPDHFRQGFVDGYSDVCNGSDGYVPAVPPEKYWSVKYQSPEGAKCVNTWFKAYPLGVKAAREDSAGAFHSVYISKMIQSALVQDKADHVLPDDVPVVAAKNEKESPSVDSELADADIPVSEDLQQTAEMPVNNNTNR